MDGNDWSFWKTLDNMDAYILILQNIDAYYWSYSYTLQNKNAYNCSFRETSGNLNAYYWSFRQTLENMEAYDWSFWRTLQNVDGNDWWFCYTLKTRMYMSDQFGTLLNTLGKHGCELTILGVCDALVLAKKESNVQELQRKQNGCYTKRICSCFYFKYLVSRLLAFYYFVLCYHLLLVWSWQVGRVKCMNDQRRVNKIM